MAGFANDASGQDIVYANNVDFSGNANVVGQFTTNGQLMIGSTIAPHILIGNLTSPSGTVTIGYSSPNITLDVASGSGVIQTVTGDTGGAESPLLGNFNLKGTANQIAVTGSANTETFSLIGPYTPSTYTLNGVLYGGGTSSIQVTSSVNSASLVTSATGVPTLLGPMTNGQMIIGSTGAIPVSNTLTAGTGIMITNGAGSITIAATASGTITTLTGNSGGAISPVAGNINTLGTGSITIVGSGNTLTTELTGLTNHAVQVGAGTATLTQVGPSSTTGQILQNNAGADPSYSTATYPSTTTINQILYSSANNVVSGLSTTNSATLVTTSAGVPVWSSTMTNGQVIIGSTGATPTAATLTAGTGITITNAAGAITIASSGSSSTLAYTNKTSGSPYTALVTDCIIGINDAASYTVKMPSSGMATGQYWIIKDESGAAATNNITISGNGANIDGASTYVMTNNYQSVTIYFNGTNFFVV